METLAAHVPALGFPPESRWAETLTDALARWTARLWQAGELEPGTPPPAFYVDGHKKPVYSDHLIPRGLLGRTGKVLGCRALLLLHDAAGHPLLALTFRGDLHLTTGVPALLERYEQAADASFLARLIVDREGMAAEFLAELVAQGRTVVTLLCSNQYQGLTSFTEPKLIPIVRHRLWPPVLPQPDRARNRVSSGTQRDSLTRGAPRR